MKKYLILFLVSLVAQSVWSKPPVQVENNKNAQFEIIPLSTPVKEETAKFLLKLPPGFEVQQISYSLKNSLDILDKVKNYSPTKLINGPSGKELHIHMGNASNGFYKLFVKVKTKKDKEKEIHYKSAYADHIRFAFEKNSTQVPQPDPDLNNSTLLGIDSDHDGVRDDVQNYINSKATTEDTRLAMRQYAASIRTRYLHKDNKANAITAIQESLRAQDCLGYKLTKANIASHEQYQIMTELVVLHKNTKERIIASDLLSSHLHGQLLQGASEESACNF